MGGEGSILGMIVSYRENMQKRRKKSMFSRDSKYQEFDQNTYANSNLEIEVKPLSEEERLKIRTKTKQYNRKIRKRLIIVFSLITVLVLIGAIKITASLITKNKIVQTKENNEVFLKMKKDYYFYLNDGDKWLDRQKWNNAIYQYKKAIEIFPNEYYANIRLAKAYLNNCVSNQKTCSEAKNLIDDLILNFPDKKSVYELRANYNLAMGLVDEASEDFKKIDELISKE